MKLVKRLVLVLLVFLAVTTLVGWLWLRGKTPDLNATVQLPGQQDSVEVLYDTYGVPHIYAQNEADLFYAFGYVHAQDRLFQMEIVRRLADGRLAEIFGTPALESDRFFRTLSFRHYARRTIDSVYRTQPNAPFVRAAEAYIRGVNAFVERGETPLEFTLVGIEKTPFTLEDIEIIQGYMGFSFAEAFRSEAVFTTILEKLGPAYLADMNGDWPADEPKIPVQAPVSLSEKRAGMRAAAALLPVAELLTKLQNGLPYPPFHGSNGWVISGRKTRSGKPILSNDTHIGFAQPSVWYEAHLVCPGFNFYGNFLAGTPFGALGHNQSGGWGLTMFENDDVDFYREKPNPANPNQVWFKDHWETLRTREEIIPVKDSAEVRLTVRESRHGILIQDVDGALKAGFSQQPIALWWTYYKFPSRSIEAFYELAHAKNATQAGAAVAKIHAPGLNFMWGDTSGTIAWWAAAKLPRRPAGVRPYLILDGSTGASDPTGWLPFSENPQILNPERGVLYSANNQPADMGGGLVPGYYVPGDRARRIEQLLFTDKKDWTPQEVRRVINDVTNPMYPALLKDILPVLKPGLDASNPNQSKSFDGLMNWDGSHELTDVEPTIFYRFIYHLYQLSIRDELGGTLSDTFLNVPSFKRNMARWLRNDASPWWDNVATPQKETRARILAQAFRRAVADLEKQLGPDIAGWQWQNVHTLTHKHPLSVAGPLMANYFNVGPLPVPGGRETLNNLDFSVDSTGYYSVQYGPALRRIVDFADPAHGTSVLPTGQSGNRASPHYADQAELFAKGEARPELMNRADIERVATGRMMLKP
ncbi:MAG: penicillin acylase family protein [Cytophagaceae bacterium]|nr:penicillin acylase family protein [Cytophagaceae bacterium]